MVAAQRFQDRTGASDPEKQRLAKEVQDFKDEAEHVSFVSRLYLIWAECDRMMLSRSLLGRDGDMKRC